MEANRLHSVSIRLTDIEHSLLTSMASECGVSAGFILRCVLSPTVHPVVRQMLDTGPTARVRTIAAPPPKPVVVAPKPIYTPPRPPGSAGVPIGGKLHIRSLEERMAAGDDAAGDELLRMDTPEASDAYDRAAAVQPKST